MNLKDEFFKWFHSNFVFTPLYSAMNNTSEASKWHREDSVGVHTAMVVAEYIKFSPNEWNTDDLCGAIACAFHDTGKPAARTEKHSEERGVYYSYPGHEQISARLWEDWAVSNWITFEKFGLVPNDIYRIGWVIEHHLPYATVKADKVGRMVETVVNMFGSNRIMSTVLLADQFGRISDDMEYNRNKVVVWVDEFNKKCDEFMATNSTNDVGKKPTCTLLIGPSGCGKSTYTEVYQALYGPVQHYSWDDLRMQWYSPKTGDVKHDYSAAWAASTEDKQFQQKADAAFNSMLSGEDVFVDNTNLTTKRRRFFVEAAHRKGYNVIGVLFPLALSTLKERQMGRDDKQVPMATVESMYFSLQLPSNGEVDNVVVSEGNL